MNKLKKTVGKDTIKLDNKKLALIGGGVVVVGIIAWLVIKNKGKKTGPKLSMSTPRTLTASVGRSRFCKSTEYPLQYGTCHPDVALLQRYLLKKGADLGRTGPAKDGVDGQFGRKTESAAKKFLSKSVLKSSDMEKIKS